MKVVRKALAYSVVLLLPTLLAACAQAPDSLMAAEGNGEDVADAQQALSADSVLNIYYSDEDFTTKVGDQFRSCVAGPIVRRGKTSEYFFQYQERCPGGGPILTYQCIDGSCFEF